MPVTSVRWEDYVRYDESVDSKLVWLIDLYSGKDMNKVQATTGTAAGSKLVTGYYTIQARKCRAKSHRVIWYLHNGDIPSGWQVDHIDGDPSNNYISNLRVVSPSENSRNKKMQSNNTSGVTGVNWHQSQGRTYWRVLWNDEVRKQRYKYFSIDRLGTDVAYAKACEFRAIKVLDGEYTGRHGM